MRTSPPTHTVRQPTITPESSWAFDWLMTGLSVYLIAGAYVDGWAHTHGRADASFFTPWHALLYSAFLAVALALVVQEVRGVARGYVWYAALPPGYNLSLLGVLVFWLGGVGDLAWHTWFGIEKDVEALFSPTHLMLAGGSWLITGGPFRAAWQRPDALPLTYVQRLPSWVSLTCMLSIMTFIMQVAHPIAAPWGSGLKQTAPGLRQIVGIVSALWDTGLMLGFLLLPMRRWLLPRGTMTLVLGLNAVAMGFLLPGPYPFGLVAVRCLAALLLDSLYARLQPSTQRPHAWRLFACLVPLILTTAHFGAIALGGGLWWSVHLWMGTIVLTSVVGLLCSYLVLPPAWPAPQEPG